MKIGTLITELIGCISKETEATLVNGEIGTKGPGINRGLTGETVIAAMDRKIVT